MERIGAFAVMILGLTNVASAGPFTQKTMQGPQPEYRAERPLVLPKGWLELGLSVESKKSVTYRGSDGVEREHPKGFAWNTSRLWLDVRQGFSPRVTLYARVPWVRASLQPVVGPPTTTVAMGDAHTGVMVQPWIESPHSLAFSLDLKAASGVEWPSGTGTAGDTQSFLTGTGITNLALFTHGKVVLGRGGSLGGDLGYVRKFPGIVGYVMQVDGFGNGVLNPGDEFNANAHLTGQAGTMFWARTSVDYRYIAEAWVGVNGDLGSRIMEPIRHSAGSWLIGELTVGIDANEHWTIELRANRDLMGADSRPFAHLGLEEFSPQPGFGFGAGVVARW